MSEGDPFDFLAASAFSVHQVRILLFLARILLF
jgi:hypothetical protein